MSEQTLNEIRDILDDIKAILLFTNAKQIEDSKKKLLEKDSIEQKVYNLCQNEKTNKEIATSIQKTEGNVRKVTSTLRSKGLIKTFKKEDGSTVNLQRF